MPAEAKKVRYELKRPESIKVMLSASERDELIAAADSASMGVSVFVRVMALEAARKRETKVA